MTTAVEFRNETFQQTREDNIPVGIEPTVEEGRVWLKTQGRKARLVYLRNLWGIHSGGGTGRDRLEMEFSATDSQGYVFHLFQDLLDGNWYERVTSGNQERTSFQPALALF